MRGMFESVSLLSLPLMGFATGLLVGLTGVGGGALMTPLLITVAGIPPAIAVGTDLLFAGITKIFGGVTHARAGHVVRPILLALIAGSLIGAALIFAAHHVFKPDATSLSRWLRYAVAVAVVLSALALLIRPWLIRRRSAVSTMAAQEVSFRPWATLALGVAIGMLVTISSIGAGAIGVVALLLLYPRLSLVRIVGTDVAYAVPIALVAGAGHALLGHVDWGLLAALLVGSLPGILLGARLCARIPEAATRTLLVAMLSLAGWKLAS